MKFAAKTQNPPTTTIKLTNQNKQAKLKSNLNSILLPSTIQHNRRVPSEKKKKHCKNNLRKCTKEPPKCHSKAEKQHLKTHNPTWNPQHIQQHKHNNIRRAKNFALEKLRHSKQQQKQPTINMTKLLLLLYFPLFTLKLVHIHQAIVLKTK